MTSLYPKAEIEIQERDIPALVKSFRQFLGSENLTKRIESAERMLAQASPIYRDYFVRPRQSLWLATREILDQCNKNVFSLRGMTPTAIAGLHRLASVQHVQQTLPSWKKREFRARLMDKSGGDIPALIEIDAASRVVMLGASIRWMSEQEAGKRAFEFVGNYRGEQFEVECKAKTVDAGRKIARGDLYQFADRLMADPFYRNLPFEPRFLTINLAGRFPKSYTDQTALMECVKKSLKSGEASSTVGASVSVESITAAELKERARAEGERFEHRFGVNDLLVSVRSGKPDEMVRSIEDDLHDALRQFSGTRPAVLVCYVPEVESFDGAESAGTATWALAQRLFKHPDAQNIISLSFVSDPKIDDRNSGMIGTGLPAVRFLANRFSDSSLSIF